MHKIYPTVLIVLYGWGYRESREHNAIQNAKTPHWDKLWAHCPHLLIEGSGHSVGLPYGQMGNSEVGHLTMGAGRVVYQELTRIDKAIEDGPNGEFFANPVFLEAFQKVADKQSALHVMGLLSPGGVHSHENHIIALLNLAKQKGLHKIYFHAFLDGRDTPPQSAEASLEKIMQISGVKIASLMGRYYAMDRDKRLERTQKAYELLTKSHADFTAPDAISALKMAYARGETDEFVQPTLIDNQEIKKIENNDVVIFMNFRADRARQLTREFLNDHSLKLAEFVTLTQYAEDIKTAVAFKPQSLANTLGEYLANLNLKQLRIAETEKYAHVTFFFNGGREATFAGEDRILVPSPKVATYDLAPEMSADLLTEKLVDAIKSQKYNLIICNYANPDMVGHTGNYQAAIRAIEKIDECLGKIYTVLKETHTEAIITADHGNAECMFDESAQQAHTAHTSDPVPFVYIGRSAGPVIKPNEAPGTLADVAPTVLYLMGLPAPKEMTGDSLLKLI